jgi:hypothetical protein
VALAASFEATHREEETQLFMAAEREALMAILVLSADAARCEA